MNSLAGLPAVLSGLEAFGRVWPDVLEEASPAFLERSMSRRERRGRPAPRERLQRGRGEEAVRLLELRNQIQLPQRRRALGVISDGSQRLRLQARLPPVEHQHGIEGRRVERRWNAAPEDDVGAPGSSASVTFGGRGIVISTVACSSMRLTVLPRPSSLPS